MPEPPSGTVTFLFTDIEGSTRRWEQDTPGMGAALERHLALLRGMIEANGGVLFKIVGDAVQAAFPTAPAALSAAVSAQRALGTEQVDDPFRLRVRMAIHTGEAFPRDGDYLAPCLNRLARLLATGFGGQLLLSQASQQLVRDHLPPGVRLRDLGSHHLRDLREPEQVFQVVSPGLRADFPPLKTPLPVRHTLPLQLTPFIGRERELAELGQRLAQDTVRLVTLVGPGGTGKTRLALQAATIAADSYADGAHFVPLAAIAAPELVMPTIAQTLGLHELADQTAFDVLVEYLVRKHLLLVLDNIEQIPDVAPFVSRLLAACPGLQVLATGRMPMRIAGEHEMMVSPLGLPTGAGATPVEAMLRSEAVHLFAARARAVKADFVLDQANALAVAEICRRLDGLPLAIELAAARVKLLPPEAMLRRLGHRLALLTGGGRDLPARHRTLRDTIAWSYDLLSPAEQAIFARLAVFVGTWTLEAAEAIARGEDDAGPDVLDGISSLLDKSLIRPDDLAAGDEPAESRFAMLQTIHEFAAERLAASGQEVPARAAHAAWYRHLGQEAEQRLIGPDAGSWLDRLEVEHDNLRGALNWFCQQRDGESAVPLAAALWRFWWARGYASEGRRWLDAALALVPSMPTAARAAALDGAGVLAEVQGDYAPARSLHEAALAAARASDDRQGIARALANLGVVAFDQGEALEAAALLDEALALARAAGEPSLTATILNDLGWVTSQRGDNARSERLLQESLALRHQIGNPLEIARTLNNLGAIAFERADYVRARRLFEESLARCDEAGDWWGRAGVLNSLAETARAEGALQQALVLYDESLVLFEAMGDARSLVTVRLNVAIASRDGHDLAGAAATYRDALGAYHRLGNVPGIVACLAGLGGIAGDQGEVEIAARLLGAAAGLATEAALEMDRIEAPRQNEDITAVKMAMGDDRFSLVWAEGRAMTLEETVRAAMSSELSAR